MVINISINPIFIPFNHWQNARFVISAVDSNTTLTPNWLQIEQINQSLIFNLSLIDSVWNYTISMNARLITFSLYSNDTSSYTTINYLTNFEFINNNWNFESINATNYLVVGKLSAFLLSFTDEEEDNILIKDIQNDYISLYIQNTNNTYQYKILLQANEIINEATHLILQYTDLYHQDEIYYKTINLELYIFDVDPPYFNSSLSLVNVNRWSNYFVTLPDIIDPNGLKWSMILGPDTPDWITLIQNSTLLLNTSNKTQNISETTIVSIKIIDEKNAWSMYNLTILTDPYTSPAFEFINNITAAVNLITEIKLDLNSSYEIQVVGWESNLVIPWIKYINNNSSLQIYPSSVNMQNQCVKLESSDSCRNHVYSNHFFIFIKQTQAPPSVGNSFGPLYVYSGQSKLFIIPQDLFLSDMLSSLKYSATVLNWSVDSKLYVNIDKYQERLYYLFIQSDDAKTCFISITTTDSNNQSAETVVQVIALNWASKDWLEWKSQYQTDWIKCKDNYRLGAYGAWYRNTTFFPNSLNNIFDIEL